MYAMNGAGDMHVVENLLVDETNLVHLLVLFEISYQ